MECRNCGKEIKEEEGIQINVHAFGITPSFVTVCSAKCHNIFTAELSRKYKETHTPGRV